MIINQIFNTGIFPDELKIAKVIPMLKKRDKSDLNNFRPIPILPVISKIIERVLHNQIYAYLNQHNLLYNHQYSFIKQHSTELAALELIDRTIIALDNGETPINIFLDMSKAFDTLNHTILLNKLHYYGIRGVSLSLFRSYLQNRKQYTFVNNTKSSILNVSTGVPQGSILWPLLVIIYINDLPHASVMYADDKHYPPLFKPSNQSILLKASVHH